MIFEIITATLGSSFAKKNFVFKNFPSDWHHHPEYELVIITEGTGTRFVGNGVTKFYPGDIAFIGANVPHFHLSDPIYYKNNDLYCSSEVVQFNLNILPADFLVMPEFKFISQLLDKSNRGLLFRDSKVSDQIRNRLSNFEQYDGLKRLTALYNILSTLGQLSDFSYLSTIDVKYDQQSNLHNLPVYRAYQYLSNNFKEPITLTQIADYAGQNTTALCRNFKQSTGNSVFNCLLEIRIDFACKLLKNSNFNINQIAYDSGFCNISHFNHKFKKTIGLSPSEFRRTHQTKSQVEILSEEDEYK